MFVKKDGAEKFEENKGKWNQMVNDIFEKGEIKSILQLTKNSATSSFLTAAIAPIFYMIFVR
ncbi:hypothetical protein CAEBREN_29109 [Caenorhabditis brenneri]|uniref:Uncharacterized protein n=1 Tax=Caenorhabditis brenneri TaxID=135651 RepID=G0NMN8_CAEBE|nr:hypothetical protein CAEBREN_29109 [Caenorhabditis brenneri]